MNTTQLKSLTIAKLTELHNSLVTQDRWVKKFRDKATGIARCRSLMADAIMDKSNAPKPATTEEANRAIENKRLARRIARRERRKARSPQEKRAIAKRRYSNRHNYHFSYQRAINGQPTPKLKPLPRYRYNGATAGRCGA